MEVPFLATRFRWSGNHFCSPDMSPPTDLISPFAFSCPGPSSDRWTDRFEQQARHHPGRTALISGESCLSYGDLDSRSNQIANHLTSLGIGRGQFVGLGLHRSLDLPVALLGILKSGAAYVPLDPGYPAERIGQMIASAKLEYVITNSKMADRFHEIRTICMDDCAVAAGSIEAPLQSPGNEDPMYAIFTPGCTGQPLTASVYHRGFGNLLHWYSIELSLGPGDRTLIISSPSFDLTQKNFFAPLITGGTLILDDCQSFDISRISGLIRDHGVTLINCTPSAFYPLIDGAAMDDYSALSSLRFAVLGGESISINRLRPWLEHPACHAEVVNTYGPAECTDICAYHRLHRGNLDEFPFVPLGRVIPHVRANNPAESPADLTDEALPGSIYRAGNPPGGLEIRGRACPQVMVDGCRVELDEIEIVMTEHDNVHQAIVTARDNRLTAHIQGSVKIQALRAYLASRLPAHMVPGNFRFVETFPLTPAGKVDRIALAESAALESATEMESRILALWSEILDRPVTDPTANFFDLGGNAIHVAIIHVRLMEMTGRIFPITELFDLPSARAVAEFLSPTGVIAATNPARPRISRAPAGSSRFRLAASR